MAKDPIKSRLDQLARENEEQLARSEGVQPTPTQEENDRAKLGAGDLSDLDNKESDGSEEQDPARVPARAPAAPAKADGDKK